MLTISLDNGEVIQLSNKSILLSVSGSPLTDFVNKKGDFDIIFLNGEVETKYNIELQQTTTIVLVNGKKVVVNVNGGVDFPSSKAVFLDGLDNKVFGLDKQYTGKLDSDSTDDADFFKMNKICSL